MVQAGGANQVQYQHVDSTLEEAFYKTQGDLCHLGIVPVLKEFQASGLTFLDSLSLMRNREAFEINLQDSGLSPEDQTCHHEIWIHLSHVSAPWVEGCT